MKILFLTESFPFPLDTGGKIVSYQMLTMLSRNHQIHLVALTDTKPTKTTKRAITSLGIKTTIIVSKKRNPWYKQPKTEMLSNMVRLKPTLLSLFYDPSAASVINDLLKTNHYDIVHVDHLSMAQYLPHSLSARLVVQEHNIEHRLMYDFARTSPLFSKEQLLYYYNALTFLKYERGILMRADQIILLSQYDKQALSRIDIPSQKMLVIPPYGTPKRTIQPKKKQGKQLLFIGNLWWNPNVSAMIWFLKNVFPIIQRENLQVSLMIIGDGAQLLDKYASGNTSISLLEKQPHVSAYIERADVFIMPFTLGQGIRIKALTAMTHGAPIVSTTVGMRGLSVRPGREYLQADTPNAFAAQITKLLRDQTLQTSFSINTKRYLQIHHNMTTIAKVLQIYYGK
jgi:polysaccharide biosynthesis protein PslH